MRRLQIMIDPELDDWLEREAELRRISKGAMVRWCVREAWEEQPYENGLASLLGMFPDADPVDDIDEVIYGPLGDEA